MTGEPDGGKDVVKARTDREPRAAGGTSPGAQGTGSGSSVALPVNHYVTVGQSLSPALKLSFPICKVGSGIGKCFYKCGLWTTCFRIISG